MMAVVAEYHATRGDLRVVPPPAPERLADPGQLADILAELRGLRTDTDAVMILMRAIAAVMIGTDEDIADGSAAAAVAAAERLLSGSVADRAMAMAAHIAPEPELTAQGWQEMWEQADFTEDELTS
jgi:hypothetical protein